MPKKFVVYISYGVYVDAPDDLDWESEEGYSYVREQAVAKMFERGVTEVSTEAEVEIEDVTEEFNND